MHIYYVYIYYIYIYILIYIYIQYSLHVFMKSIRGIGFASLFDWFLLVANVTFQQALKRQYAIS